MPSLSGPWRGSERSFPRPMAMQIAAFACPAPKPTLLFPRAPASGKRQATQGQEHPGGKSTGESEIKWASGEVIRESGKSGYRRAWAPAEALRGILPEPCAAQRRHSKGHWYLTSNLVQLLLADRKPNQPFPSRLPSCPQPTRRLTFPFQTH